MSLSTDQQKLEKYFAEKYTDKYIEFGGYFYIEDYRIFSKSPMYKYFSSGNYKELNDLNLESYWAEIKKHDTQWTSIVIAILLSVVILAYLQNT